MSQDFADDEVHIPRVHETLSAKRVLTMEWCDGDRIDDRAALAARGVDVKELATRVQHLFGRMTFVHGFTHCDPHPGNILVGDNGKAVQADIIILGDINIHGTLIYDNIA